MDRLWTPWRYAYVTGAAPGANDASETAANPEAAATTDPAAPLENASPSKTAARSGATSASSGRSRFSARCGIPAALDAWPGDHGCVFCNMIAAVDYAVARGATSEDAEAAAWIVERGATCFVVLNAFPYNSGHLMAVPYLHEPSLAGLPLPVAKDLMRLTRRAERVLRAVYQPDGLNLGINLGESAGAGVAGHLHLHAVPRWSGDSNYMSVLAETRILPETLDQSWRRLRAGFAAEPEEEPEGTSPENVVETSPASAVEKFVGRSVER